jgi:hypothetical protein
MEPLGNSSKKDKKKVGKKDKVLEAHLRPLLHQLRA